ncbi:MAG TPA: hypothetical protein VKS81_01220 [Bacteroidota bacterium]|nr:hypothetical protein [Bacteroidota bacterium]
MIISLTSAFAQNGGDAGAYERLGFGSRGMGLGNAMTAVTTGAIQTYYNPALAAFSDGRYASATFSILSLDRSLNFLSYTQAVKPTAGISFGIINSGVSNIDGRDADGNPTGPLSTMEDEAYLAFANRMTPNFSLGVAVKLLYAKLYDKISTTNVGFDIGLCYIVVPDISVGATIQDLGSKYTWDTTPIYDTDGRTTTDNFPTLRRIGVAYSTPAKNGLVSVEFENSSESTNLIRFGGEYYFVENFGVRAGLDRWMFGSEAAGAKPSFGFTVKNPVGSWVPTVTYAFVVEPFTSHGEHIITISGIF